VTYRITAPGNIWDSIDNGTYTIAIEGSQVSDNFGRFITASTLKTFAVNVPRAVLTADGTLIVNGSDSNNTIALSLVNGSPCASALVADAALAARRRLELAEEVFALSSEALKVPLGHFAEDLEDLWGDPAEGATLARLRRLMAGGAEERRPYQAPVSFRVLPRVLAQFRRSTEAAENAATTSLRAITDNPVFLAAQGEKKGRVFSTGGYHNAMAYPTMDNIAAAMADLCLLADRHTSKLLDGRYSLLPDQLQQGEGYLGCLGMVQVGYAEEARRAAQRNFLPGSEGGGFGNAPGVRRLAATDNSRKRCLRAGRRKPSNDIQSLSP